MAPEPTYPTLRDYVNTVWKRRWVVATVMFIVLVAVFFYGMSRTPTYQTSAEVIVRPVITSLAQQFGGQVVIENEIVLAQSADVAQKAELQLGGDSGSLSVSNPSGSLSLIFTSSAKSPGVAQATANAYANAYLDDRKDRLGTDIRSQIDQTNGLIEQISAELQSYKAELQKAQDDGNQQRVEELNVLISAANDRIATQLTNRDTLTLQEDQPVGQVLAPAPLPRASSGPSTMKLLLLGLFVGFGLGVGAAFLWDRLDVRVRTTEDLEEQVGAPVVGRIPKGTLPDGRIAVEGDESEVVEAFRAMRARFLFATAESGEKTIVVSSARAREGKTTVAVNFGAILAHGGKRVILISGDLRNPIMDLFAGIDEGPRRGLTDVLTGDASLGDVLIETETEGLMMIPSGTRRRANPSELLASGKMSELLADLDRSADVILIDSAPVLGAADVLHIGPLADGVLLVADARQGSRSTIRQAVNDLRSAGAHVLGVVWNRVEPDSASGYYGNPADGSLAPSLRTQNLNR